MSFNRIISAAMISSRSLLSVSTTCSRSFSTLTSPLMFRITHPLCAEPMKKKKRVDPAVAKSREDRRKRKMEKEIKKLKKNAQQLKPIDELEIPYTLVAQKNIRTRPAPQLSEEVIESRADLLKEWTTYRSRETQKDYKLIDRLVFSQQNALDELRLESEELYQEAIQIDLTLLPFSAKGPLHTPPLQNYESPDGDYSDISRNFEKEYEDRKAAMEDILNKNKKPHQIKKKKK
uniref:Large ribosomal subunit protein mL40 n=1 Tax=Cacopsylla melanoneura TaxID=428564 RepID=A0A8D9A0P0_9HEMI